MYTVLTKIFHLVYAELCVDFVHKESKNHCNGCQANHPNQDQHDCLMLDEVERWNLFYDTAKHQVDTNRIWDAALEVCAIINISLHTSWKTYLPELYKQPWTSVYLWYTQLEQFFSENTAQKVAKCLSSGWTPPTSINEVPCPSEFSRKDEEPMDYEFLTLQNRLQVQCSV